MKNTDLKSSPLLSEMQDVLAELKKSNPSSPKIPILETEIAKEKVRISNLMMTSKGGAEPAPEKPAKKKKKATKK